MNYQCQCEGCFWNEPCRIPVADFDEGDLEPTTMSAREQDAAADAHAGQQAAMLDAKYL